MPSKAVPSPVEIVNRRFRIAAMDHPVTAALHELALQRAESCLLDPDFSAGMHVPLPELDEYLALRGRVSLLPLDRINDRIQLPPLPGIVTQLQQAIELGHGSERLADIIRPDPRLTSSIISLANSPLYAMPKKIETLGRAITVIGTREISSLALGTRIMAMFEDTPPQGLPLNTFWKHSLACAVFAHEIATLCNKANPERYFTAGLLHDLGRVMLFSRYPEQAKAALALHQAEGVPLHEAELQVFDVDHCMVGGVFFAEWNLPSSLIHSALYHHAPDMCAGKDVPEVIYIANQVTTALGIGCNGTYRMEPGNDIWSRLDIGVEKLRLLVKNMDERLWPMFLALFPEKGNSENGPGPARELREVRHEHP